MVGSYGTPEVIQVGTGTHCYVVYTWAGVAETPPDPPAQLEEPQEPIPFETLRFEPYAEWVPPGMLRMRHWAQRHPWDWRRPRARRQNPAKRRGRRDP